MKTIGILNLKGGVGKTTTAVHLAAAGHYAGDRTLLVDLDPQSSATDHVKEGAFGAASAGGYLLGRCTFDEACTPVLAEGGGGLDLMPSGDLLLSEAEVMMQARGSKKTLRTTLGREREGAPYRFAVMDSGPGLNFLWFNVLYASDLVIVPVELQMAAIQGLKRLHEMLAFAREEDGLDPTVWYLPTNNDRRIRESTDLLGVLHEQFGALPEGRVLPSIRYSAALSKAYAQRTTIFGLDPKDRAAEDYASLYHHVATFMSDGQS